MWVVGGLSCYLKGRGTTSSGPPLPTRAPAHTLTLPLPPVDLDLQTWPPSCSLAQPLLGPTAPVLLGERAPVPGAPLLGQRPGNS